MGTFLFSLSVTAVLTLPVQCNAMEGMAGMDSVHTDDDIYRQLLRRVDNLERRDQKQQAEIDTLRGELNTEKQRTSELESRIELIQTLAEQRRNNEANLTYDEAKRPSSVDVDTNQQASYQPGEPTPIRKHRSSKPGEEVASRIRRHLNMPVVAFHATLTSDAVHTGVHQSIAFDHVVTNIGTAYNPHVGSFVAPVAGVYVFHTTLMVVYHDVIHASIVRNGVAVAYFYGRGAESMYDSAGGMVVVHLNKGDDVMVQNNDADKAFHGYHYTMFSGFLLYQDNAESIVG